MITANNILSKIKPKSLTPTNRLIGLIFFLINLPTLAMTIAFPPSIIISFPGMILFYFYWKIYFREVDPETAESVWRWTIYYNLALMLGFIIVGGGIHAWPALLFQAFAIGMAGVGIRDLKDLKKEDSLKWEKKYHEAGEEDIVNIREKRNLA